MIGKTLSHYRVVEKIGAGGMGEVYRARDEHLGRDVALKVLPAGTLGDEHARKRFRKEAQALSKLSHPHIATVFDFDTQDGTDFLVMELVEGVTLSDKLVSGPLPEKEITRLGAQLAEGLTAAHERRVVHRDLKPANLRVTPDGRLKILDFGLAKLVRPDVASATAPTESFTETQGVAGTLPYMAPEQLRGEQVDARTDIHALGAVLYEMATGQRPFPETQGPRLIDAILNRAPQPPSGLNRRVSPVLEGIILKALEKEPENRYQSAKEIAVDLRRLKRDTNSGRAAVAGAAGVAAPTKKRWRVLASGAALVALVIGGAVWFQFLRPSSKSEMAPMRVVPLTSLLGNELDPALSPDGNQLAFPWDGETGDNFDIYVKLIGAETTLRLTDDPARDCCPAWSPDGRSIAFMRISETKSEIFIVPALGGPERKLPTTSGAIPFLHMRFASWSPDGRFLAFADRDSDQEPYAIFLVSVESLERHKLSAPPAKYWGDGFPVFSPDGKTLALVRIAGESVSDIYLQSVAGGEPRRLTFGNRWIHGLDWTPDGSEIVYSSGLNEGRASLWRISASGGAPERLAVGGDAYKPSISGQGHRLAYVQNLTDSNIWRIELQSSTGRGGSPTRLIASTRGEIGPQFSPDGKSIAFCSSRSGTSEIWLCDSDGSNCLQLTSFEGPLTCAPRWSPDGQRIAFDSWPGGHGDIFVVDVERRVPRRLITSTSDDVVSSWSNDGRWIYFSSNRSGTYQLWKAPAEGGPAVQMTKNGGFAPLESPDGQFVYYAKFKDPGIWKVSVQGGEETLILDHLQPGLWGYWAVVEEGIYFLNAKAEPRPAIEFYRFATRQVTRVFVPEKDPIYGNPGLALSPDGRWILYAQMDQTQSDIMLVENFR